MILSCLVCLGIVEWLDAEQRADSAPDGWVIMSVTNEETGEETFFAWHRSHTLDEVAAAIELEL